MRTGRWIPIRWGPDDGDAGGGGADVGDEGGSDGGTKTATKPTTKPAAKPATGVKLDTELPESDRPEIWKSYKTLADAAKAHGELRTEFNNRSTRLKSVEADLKKSQETIESQQKEREAAQARESMSANTKLWQESVDAYAEGEGAADPDLILKLMDATGLPEQAILDVHQQHFDRRNQFMTRVKEQYPDIDPVGIRAWFDSGEAPFSPGMVEAFFWLAERDEIGWVKTVNDAYQKHLKGESGRPAKVARGTKKPAPMRGRPATGNEDVYKTKAEFNSDYAKATKVGEGEVEKVIAKLQRSNPDTLP